jgi:predicted phosphodiesterase
MRYLILSDIHANLEALEAVLVTVPPGSYDRVLVLGDLVGYGADPNAVVDRVRGLRPDLVIRGNHDKVASGVEDADGFNYMAREAADWTYEQLTPDNRNYVAGLPHGPKSFDALVEICHGAPFDEDAYIFDPVDALHALRTLQRPICFFGHTHLPVIFYLTSSGLELMSVVGPETRLTLHAQYKYLINPGSVGQPRDGDPRAAYGMLNTDTRELVIRRVPYPLHLTQEKISAAGLPQALAHRLALGR